MRWCVLVLLAACWTGTSAKPASDPPRLVAHTRQPEQPQCSQETFDPSNAACLTLCVRTAPQGWPGCTAMADGLMARGYICSRPTPFACSPPPITTICPSGCPPFRARIIGIGVTPNHTEVTIGAGTARGVTPSWRATLVDANDQPIPNGEITVLSVDQRVTKGAIALPPDQLARHPLVWLAPFFMSP